MLAGAGVVLLLIAAGAAELVARRLVRHLTAAAETADLLGEGDLTARVPDEGPEEVRRVGAALNRLAGRIDELLAAERETVADLSHRLRTPMTAVRLDVESLPDSDRKAELEEHFAHLERTLTAVIHAARRPQREGLSPHCDATAVARDRFEFWAPLAEDQGRDITLSVPPGAVAVRCAAADLATALDALLENALAHTAEGIGIAVVLEVDDDGTARLDVRDTRPRSSADRREAWSQRPRLDRSRPRHRTDLRRGVRGRTRAADPGGLVRRPARPWTALTMCG